MLRYIVLTFVMVTAAVQADVPNSDTTEAAKSKPRVVVQDDMVLLFDNDIDVENHDIKRCYNAFVDSKNFKKIEEILKKGKNPSLTTSVIKNFFDRSVWSYSTSGHYKYQGKEVQDLCQREDLVVIKSVKSD